MASAAAAARGERVKPLAETDYFSHRVAERLPHALRSVPVAKVLDSKNLGKEGNVMSNMTVGQVLSTDLRALSLHTHLEASAVESVRRKILVYLEHLLSGRKTG